MGQRQQQVLSHPRRVLWQLSRMTPVLVILLLRTERTAAFPIAPSHLTAAPTRSFRVGTAARSLRSAPAGQKKRRREPHEKKRHLPRRIARIYTDYASRLWRETSPEARRTIANNRVVNQLRLVQHLIESEENLDHSDVSPRQRAELVDACDAVLKSLGRASEEEKRAQLVVPQEEAAAAVEVSGSSTDGAATAKKKPRRSIGFGALMGLVVACWVFSGNYIFTGLFTLMTILGQLEYYRMVINTGVYPARRISVLGACAMFFSALFTPELHEICLPLWGLYAMVWFLTMKRTVTTIPGKQNDQIACCGTVS